MDATLVIVALAALVVVATALGLLYKHLQGRARRQTDNAVITIDGLILGERATLLQFSTEVCAPCVATARVLKQIAGTTSGVSYVDIDVSERPELAARFNLLQTPTTFLLDATGALQARIGGSVRRDELLRELDRVLAPSAPSTP